MDSLPKNKILLITFELGDAISKTRTLTVACLWWIKQGLSTKLSKIIEDEKLPFCRTAVFYKQLNHGRLCDRKLRSRGENKITAEKNSKRMKLY